MTEQPIAPPTPRTLRELRDSGWRSRTVKEELRSNLLERLGEGETVFPGIVGYDDSVLPAIENAILAGQDLIFLGERGQAKTRPPGSSSVSSIRGCRSSRAASSTTTRPPR